jgi:NAD(P)-dependent dehydrogenase (short-subunit alcohol dehydrogenase family)
MKGRHVIVTGSTKGIGRAGAEALAAMGAVVTLHGRSAQEAEAAAAEIRLKTGNPDVRSIAFDLSSLASVRQAAAKLAQENPRLDALCLNAGVFLAKRELSADGFEKTWATRFLGHLSLAKALLPQLEAAQGRIVVTAAPPNGFKIDWDDVNCEKSYSTFKAVSQGMAALLMGSLQLAELEKGKGVTLNFFHPGVVKTTLLKEMPWIVRFLLGIFGADPSQGADTMAYLASDPALQGVSGQYFHKRKSRPFKGQVAERSNWERAWALHQSQAGA